MKSDPELTGDHEGPASGPGLGLLDLPAPDRRAAREAGEWPHPEAHYYGFPQFPDTYVTFYRKDLFCNEKEAREVPGDFSQKLPCTYEDWQQVDWDVWAQHRQALPAQEGRPARRRRGRRRLLRHRLPGRRRLRLLDHGVNAFIWQNGGSIWDETKAPEGQALGVVNSDTNVKAFEQYLEHAALHAAGGEDRPDGHLRRPGPVHAGQGRGDIDWVGLGEPVLDPKTSKVCRQVGVRRGARAPARRTARSTATGNIGGQPFVLTTWNSDEVNEAALEVVKWWLNPETQKKFVANGGQSGLRSVMADPEYDSLRPWNRAHKEMIDWQRDVWHIPEFFELLTQQQQEFDKAITGQISAKEALDSVAEFQDRILRDADRIE